MKGALAFDSILQERIDARFKGYPSASEPRELGAIAAQRWSLRDGDVPLPALAVRTSALDHNIAYMQAYCRERGIELAPHGKTTMCPQIFDRQMAAGAWGITVATVQQLAVCVAYGYQRIIVANQVAGAGNLNALGRLLATSPGEVYVYADSRAGVGDLQGVAERFGIANVRVLVEIGYAGGRTGARSLDEVNAVFAAIAEAPALEACGVATYEGLLATGAARSELAMRALLARVVESVDALVARSALPERFIVSAGGSASFDLAAEELGKRWSGRATLILRPGCYVVHDHGVYDAAGLSSPSVVPLRGALELWAAVQSLPEPGLAYLTFGRRDASFDAGFPIPLARIGRASNHREPVDGMTVTELNDQHARVRYDAVPLEVGDTIVLGISHPCGALDRWRLLFAVDDDDVITESMLTFF